MDRLFNTSVLTDRRLSPTDKIVYVGLASKQDRQGRSTITREELWEIVTMNRGGSVVRLSDAKIDETLFNLQVCGYLTKGNKIILGNMVSDTVAEEVDKILDYVSTSRIVRGYTTRKLTGKTHKSAIAQILKGGYSVKECLAVVNYRFESEWHKKNSQYLTPTVIFNQEKFDTALAELEDVEEWGNKVITKFGIEEEIDMTEVEM